MPLNMLLLVYMFIREKMFSLRPENKVEIFVLKIIIQFTYTLFTDMTGQISHIP